MLKSLLSCGIAAMAIGMATLPARSATVNLITNGTFDTTTEGWNGDYQLRSADPWIDTGSYFFPGPGAFHMIYQDYALSAAQLSSLANGGLGFTLSADLFGWHTQADRGTLSVFFMAGDDRIGSATLLSSTVYSGSWDIEITAGGKYFQSLTGYVPLATTSLSFIITSTRVGGGTNNDGYIDNAFFGVEDLAPVPLPAALPLLGGGMLALAGIARRKRKAPAV